MERNELQTGSIVYSPVTADVSFHLEVTGPDNSKTAAESVRVLRTRPSPMPEEAAKSGPAGKPATEAANPSQASAAEGGESAEPEPAPVKLATASRAFKAAPLAQRLRPALSSDIPDAPGLGSNPGQAAAASINLGAIVPLTAMPAPAPETRALAPAQTSQLRPAELISRKAPEYPAIAMQTHASGEVRVQAVIAPMEGSRAPRPCPGPRFCNARPPTPSASGSTSPPCSTASPWNRRPTSSSDSTPRGSVAKAHSRAEAKRRSASWRTGSVGGTGACACIPILPGNLPFDRGAIAGV